MARNLGAHQRRKTKHKATLQSLHRYAHTSVQPHWWGYFFQTALLHNSITVVHVYLIKGVVDNCTCSHTVCMQCMCFKFCKTILNFLPSFKGLLFIHQDMHLPFPLHALLSWQSTVQTNRNMAQQCQSESENTFFF